MFALTAHDPRRVGPYPLFASLGEGGMGHVYLATGPDGRPLAVKRVLPHLARDAGFRQRFALEVATARRVESPHTVRLVDADTDAEQPWLASEFIPGPTLIQHLQENGPIPEQFVRRLGIDLAAALGAIHGAGLVHRDLKPSNVILATTGAKLLDFGISRAIDYSTSVALTQTGGVVGSPGYMSPEQAQSQPLTERSDIFALGCLLVAATTGRAPFDAPSIPQVLYKVVYEQPDLHTLPDSLRAPVLRCLAKDPSDRPSPAELTGLLAGPGTVPGPPLVSVAAFAERQRIQVNAFVNAAAVRPTLVDEGPTEVLSPPAGPRRRFGRPALIAGAAAAALLLAVPLGIVLFSDDDPPTGDDGAPLAGAHGGDEGAGGGSAPEESELSIPSPEELCEILDAEGLADSLDPEWEVSEVQEDDTGCRASVRDGGSLGHATVSISVTPTEEDSWLLCPFTECDYADTELVPNGESTARPWEMGGIVDGTGLEMIWYQDGLAGVVRMMTLGSSGDTDEDTHEFLLDRGIALYDLATEG